MPASNKLTPADIDALLPCTVDDLPTIGTARVAPTNESLTLFQDAINAQAAAIPSSANGDLGHLGLVCKPTEYLTVSANNAFVTPTDPGPNPTHQQGATAAQITENIRQHEITSNVYQTYCNAKTKLRNMIVKKVDDKYIQAHKHAITQYNRVDPLTLLDHLWTHYGNIESLDLTANETRMYADWNPPTSIETLWNQLQDGKDYARRGGEIIDDTVLVRKAYQIILKTGLFDYDCKEWRNKPAVDKTWPNFRTFFTAAVADQQKHNPTTRTAGYANAVKELVQQEMEQMLQTIMDADVPEVPSTAPPAPPTESPQSPSECANAAVSKEDISKMIAEAVAAAQQSNQGRRKPKVKQPMQGYDDDGVPITYCWSHGITKNLNHNSMTCSMKKEGHKDQSTLTNRMGGCDDRCKARTKPAST